MEPRFKTSTNLTFSVQGDDLELMNQLYDQISNGQSISNKEFIRGMALLAMQARENSSEWLQEEVAKLNRIAAERKIRIEQLEQQIKDLPSLDNSAEVDRLNEEIIRLMKVQETLTSEIDQLREQLSGKLELDPERQFIVTMDPFTAYLMQATCQGETKRLGEEITPDQLLLQMFLSYYQYGEHEHFPFYFTRKELRQLVEHFKNLEENPETSEE